MSGSRCCGRPKAFLRNPRRMRRRCWGRISLRRGRAWFGFRVGTGKGKNNSKDEMRGSLRYAMDGETVHCFGRDDEFFVGVEKNRQRQGEEQRPELGRRRV